MVKLIFFFVLAVANVLSLLMVLIQGIRLGICACRHRECVHIVTGLKRSGIGFGSVFLLLVILIIFTQLLATTPQIRDNNGKLVEGSIAELKKVSLNGHEEWISIRGESKEAPVLLFLAGGPGGTQLAATRYELAELEKHFVVVNWDQPGSGKSCNCMKKSDITVQTYIEDGVALTEYLRERFQQEKIYLVGESWGSALGIFLLDEKPEYYAGFIGTGQMVNFKESEIVDYHKAIEIAKEQKDEKLVRELEKQGEPPYYDGNVAMKSAAYLNYLSTYMAINPDITNGGYNTFRDMFAAEYGVFDSVNYMLGLVSTFNVVYPTLYEVDLREDYAKLEVPVYFFIGRHDVNAPTAFAEEYYQVLEAPDKELVWFEHSGHGPWMNETERFVEETLRVFGQ